MQPRATRHSKTTAAGREWAATLALVAHYHRELRIGRKSLSPGERRVSDHPPTLPACTHLDRGGAFAPATI
ncbi:MAG: hypothetical protein ACRDJ3_04300 [Solirubrobacteraceae bacterium]